jgi:Ser/Thr protein kinase RdoA (MazF antagonist)
MDAASAARAVEAARSTGAELGLHVDDAIVLNNSNKLTARLTPCDVVARIAPAGQEALQFEVDVAQALAAAGCPVASLDPRVAPRVYERGEFVLTLWTYYEPVAPRVDVPPDDYANALARLHAGMRTLHVVSPHFTDRVAEAQQLVATRELSPALTEADRDLLRGILGTRRQAIAEQRGAEQLLHGEPHPGNVVNGPSGLVFVDFETCCRGPIEFDLAHVPEAVSACYPGADQRLLDECRALVLAMVAAWRCEAGDQLPNREEGRERLLAALRSGPPWPTLDTVMPSRS